MLVIILLIPYGLKMRGRTLILVGLMSSTPPPPWDVYGCLATLVQWSVSVRSTVVRN